MTSFFVKVITLPIILFLSMYLSNNVDYGAIWQPFVIVIALTIVGIALEYVILSEDTQGASLFLDFITAFLIIWGLSNMFAGAEVTFMGALVTAFVIGACEYFLHRYLVGSEKATKSPA